MEFSSTCFDAVYQRVYLRHSHVKYSVVFFAMLALLGILLFPKFSHAGEASAWDWKMLSQIADKFRNSASLWSKNFTEEALKLFKVFTVISIAMFGIQAALNQKTLEQITAELVKLLTFTGFMLFMLHNYTDITKWMLQYFSELAGSTGAPEMNPGAVMAGGFELIRLLLDSSDFLDLLPVLICCIILLIIFALISAQMLLVMCEVYVCMNAGIILLGFGAFEPVKQYAINFMRYTLSAGIKLFTMQLTVGLGMQFVRDLKLTKAAYPEIMILIGTLIVLLALVQNLPDMVAGIVNGTHVSTSNAINSAVRTIGTSVTAASGAAMLAKSKVGQAGTAVEAMRAARQMGGGLSDGMSMFNEARSAAKGPSNNKISKEWIQDRVKEFEMSKEE